MLSRATIIGKCQFEIIQIQAKYEFTIYCSEKFWSGWILYQMQTLCPSLFATGLKNHSLMVTAYNYLLGESTFDIPHLKKEV